MLNKVERIGDHSRLTMFVCVPRAVCDMFVCVPRAVCVVSLPEGPVDGPSSNSPRLAEVTGLGMLGIDRMYLGGVNVLLGILKLFTVGGCGLWFVVDYVVLLQNAVSEQPDIDFFGMHYTWQKSTLGPARTVGLVGCGLFLLSCFCSCCGSLYQRKWIPTTKQELLA